jgi:hypothetical protein
MKGVVRGSKWNRSRRKHKKESLSLSLEYDRILSWRVDSEDKNVKVARSKNLNKGRRKRERAGGL